MAIASKGVIPFYSSVSKQASGRPAFGTLLPILSRTLNVSFY
ncbi:hypothetical protein [Sphingomonas yabuuchiae]|nr:hypothetical protein [Sphingomonas yabuuchiae]